MTHHSGIGNSHDERTRQQLLGEAWWTSEFLAMIRPGKDTTQLVKGRRLAERGQVIIQGIYAGGVEAIILEAVGGSHRTAVWIADLDDNWEVVFRIFAVHQVLFSRLLSGEYSKDLDAILKEAGICIIPASLEDLDYRCDCESGHHTCSHIVATYLALGYQVNTDPLILFLLRGKTREEIIAGVSQYSSPETVADEETSDMVIPLSEAEDPINLNLYYDPGPDFESVRIREVSPSDRVTALITLLGPSPFRLGKVDLADLIRMIYPKTAGYCYSEFLKQDQNPSDGIACPPK